jgi:glycosyltransferase involved in cell wall biosynthesis
MVHNSYQQRGGEDAVFEQETEMLKAGGHDVEVYFRSNTEIKDYSRTQRALLPLRTIWAADARADLARLIRNHRPEVVHVHNTFMLISPAIYGVCKSLGVPVVTTLHNYRLLCPSSNFFRAGSICEECVEHSLLRSIRYGCYRESRSATATVAAMLAFHHAKKSWTGSDCLIALNEFARNKFISCGFPAEKLVIKPNFVDPDPGAGTGVRSGAVFAGRLTEEKGVRTLLSAWELLPRTMHLTIIGDGPLKSELMARALAVKMPNIHFTGSMKRPDVLEAIKKASFVVFPSEWFESFPLALLEAYACATPLIASNVGAVGEIVKDGVSGFLYSPGDVEQLAALVKNVYYDSALLNEMGLKGRQLYLTKYTAAQNQSLLLEIYERCIRQAGSQNAAGVPTSTDWTLSPEESSTIR